MEETQSRALSILQERNGYHGLEIKIFGLMSLYANIATLNLLVVHKSI